MDAVGGFLSSLFWGILLLSFLVLIHEGAHFCAARLFHVRVTEFFLGMPSRLRISFRSKRFGTEFGVTPLLIGGYNRICGLDTEPPAEAVQVLACVHKHGKVEVGQIAEECGISADKALDLLIALNDWASVKPFYDPEKGERPGQRYYPDTWMSPERDGRGLTAYDDGHDFAAPGHVAEGEPFELPMSAQDFYQAERSHTFHGLGLAKKLVILLAGVFINITFGILLYAAVLSIVGVSMPVDQNAVGVVVAESPAARAGLQEGDVVLSVNGSGCSTWVDVSDALAAARESSGEAKLIVERNGSQQEVTMTLQEGDELFGVNCPTAMTPLPFDVSLRLSFGLAGRVLQTITQLFIPTHTLEVLKQSSSVVGVSVIASQAVEQDFSVYLYLVASVSLSLGFMNLLPIPLLDGGKVILELLQAISRRKLSPKFVNGWSYVGIVLLLGLFVYTLRADIMRIVSGTMVLG